MLKYIGRRILLFIPTLFIITLLGFIIAINAPGDPVEKMLTSVTSAGDVASQSSSLNQQKQILKRKLGLDLPVFYFSVSNIATPDTLYRITDKNENLALSRLIDKYGNWEYISNYYLDLKKLHHLSAFIEPDTNFIKAGQLTNFYEAVVTFGMEAKNLAVAYKDTIIKSKLNALQSIALEFHFDKNLKNEIKKAIDNYETIRLHDSKWKVYIPAFNFYGLKNQYHRWLFGDNEFSNGLVRFDFGTSYSSKLPISQILKNKIGWSLFFSLFSIIVAYAVSIPLGVSAAQKKGSFFDKASSLTVFMLYSLPNFFVAFLLMLLLANPNILSILPASGVKPAEGYPAGSGLFEHIKISLPYIVMPLICYTYSSFAFLSRTMRASIIENLGQDYIRTARAKGLSEKAVMWKHAFRNSLLPIITVFANIFPAAVGGSVILESIFTIPGMGLEVFNAISGQDYPMIIAVMTLTGVLTLIGFLISDILYALVDPRINYK